MRGIRGVEEGVTGFRATFGLLPRCRTTMRSAVTAELTRKVEGSRLWALKPCGGGRGSFWRGEA
jgi:hypothetical protein